MRVVVVFNTKGGVGKTTLVANLGGLAADADLRVLMLDLDIQPTLSSYFELSHLAFEGVYELLALNQRSLEQLISHTRIPRLDLIVSNDPLGQLGTLLLHAPDGRLRLRNLLPIFTPHYDLLLIDTQGARSVLLEMALLAADLALSPVVPEILAARELHRGTLQLLDDIAPYCQLGIQPPPLHLLINRVHPVSLDARHIQHALREVLASKTGIHVLQTSIPALDAYPRAATLQLPVHRVEYHKPRQRSAPSALDSMCDVASELLPIWAERFAQLKARQQQGADHA